VLDELTNTTVRTDLWLHSNCFEANSEVQRKKKLDIVASVSVIGKLNA